MTIFKLPVVNNLFTPAYFPELMQSYFLQLRQELGIRIVEKVFDGTSDKPSKWWMCFVRRRFMDKSLSGAANV